jgi:multiple sugar transport system permease protein
MPMTSNSGTQEQKSIKPQSQILVQKRVGRAALWFFRWMLPPLIGFCFLIPVLFLVLQSLMRPYVPPEPQLSLPIPPYVSNYVEVFQYFSYLSPFINSLIVEAVAVPLTLITASLAGFAMAQIHGRVGSRIVFFTIALMLVPLPALWIPRFVLYRNLGLTDQLGALMAPAIAGSSPFFILIFYWTFRRLPRSLFEAAKLDGATLFQIWRLIGLPLAKPSLAVVAVLSFTLYWNDYMSPLIFLQDIPKYTVAIRMQLFQGGDVLILPLQMAGVVVSSLPVVIMFLLVQRYFWPEGRSKIDFGQGVETPQKGKKEAKN